MKTALVTGGSGEIGSAICRKFAENGYSVVITYNTNRQKAEQVQETLAGKDHSIFKAPNTDASCLADLYDYVERKYGKLDVLVNNTGITTPVAHNDLEGLTDEWIDKIMQTNFRGSFAMVRVMRELLEAAAEKKSATEDGGRNSALVVNISSIAGLFGIGSNVAYCASKAALDSMTRSLARVLAPKIRVMSVSPGFVEGEYTKNFPPEFLQSQMEHTPMEQFATGADVANAVFALADQLKMSTGGILTVDGGRLLL
ncbi:SDR family NAD(P)-dependent oxidoreductase [Jiulongibacter sp. NS-SX5]|uniref:SDR family NAD(P)-dependent oxidoreductase n=1 Tax=Jiulongibacter sp. NS-SX5 TaxID=3463854 RepID=UPI004057D1E1